VAWPEPLLPLESVGELVPVELELDEPDELLDDDEPVVEVLVELLDEAAYAATPTASVPATLAATSAPVIAVVRRSPVSRSMIASLIC
jgi:hypothetical protein